MPEIGCSRTRARQFALINSSYRCQVGVQRRILKPLTFSRMNYTEVRQSRFSCVLDHRKSTRRATRLARSIREIDAVHKMSAKCRHDFSHIFPKINVSSSKVVALHLAFLRLIKAAKIITKYIRTLSRIELAKEESN